MPLSGDSIRKGRAVTVPLSLDSQGPSSLAPAGAATTRGCVRAQQGRAYERGPKGTLLDHSLENKLQFPGDVGEVESGVPAAASQVSAATFLIQ